MGYDINTKRCGCGQIHRVRETCPKCAEKRRQELEQTRPRKETPVPGYDGNGWYCVQTPWTRLRKVVGVDGKITWCLESADD